MSTNLKWTFLLIPFSSYFAVMHQQTELQAFGLKTGIDARFQENRRLGVHIIRPRGRCVEKLSLTVLLDII